MGGLVQGRGALAFAASIIERDKTVGPVLIPNMRLQGAPISTSYGRSASHGPIPEAPSSRWQETKRIGRCRAGAETLATGMGCWRALVVNLVGGEDGAERGEDGGRLRVSHSRRKSSESWGGGEESRGRRDGGCGGREERLRRD